ncbi:MAG: hypothetical protein H5U19_05915 [Rhodobacteraceae bacterium]|nr:hypothetical protein [Paracoccaceae bacterium]
MAAGFFREDEGMLRVCPSGVIHTDWRARIVAAAVAEAPEQGDVGGAMAGLNGSKKPRP